jgi:ADP-ribose pyrophosphatase
VSSPTPDPDLVLAAGKYLRLVKRGRWEFADRHNTTGAVVIVAVTPTRCLLLVEQFRVPLNAPTIELPAGLVGDEPGTAGEALEIAARRELLEETGYAATRFTYLTHGPTSAGLSTEVVTLLQAHDLRREHAGGGVGHEAITVHEVPLGDAHAWLTARIAAGTHVDPKVFAGLYFVGRCDMRDQRDSGDK